MAVLGILSLPLRELADVWNRRCAWRVAREKCEVVFARPAAPRRRHVRGEPAPVRLEAVRFRELEFDLAVEPSEKVLVGGASGSGKSSLFALVTGLERPESGRIDFGGRAERPLTVYVSARSPVLRGSLRSALTLGLDKRPDDATIEASARRFGLGALLERLGGLDGRVGEGGRTLSDGEKLRLHLARAALSAPDLMVLELPGRSADTDLSAAVAALLRDAEATIFVAASDPALVPFADRRLLVENGSVREAPAAGAGARPSSAA